MKTLIATLIITLASTAYASFTNFSHSTSNNSYLEGLEILEEVADIPRQRLRDLQCKRYPSNRDLCSIEKNRLSIANKNVRRYNGSLQILKNNVQNDIYEREIRMSDLRCDRRRSPNRDLCRVESYALDTLEYDILPQVERLVDRMERDRRKDERNDRKDRCRKRNCDRDNDGRRGKGKRRRP